MELKKGVVVLHIVNKVLSGIVKLVKRFIFKHIFLDKS